MRAIHQGRVACIAQEADSRIKRAMRAKIRTHKIEDAEEGNEVYYRLDDGKKKWRGPAKVVGKNNKVVIVQHGAGLKEVSRVHITKVRRKGEESVEEESEEEEREQIEEEEKEEEGEGEWEEDREEEEEGE